MRCLAIFIFPLILGCNKYPKNVEIKIENGEVANGTYIADSIFDGTVKYYNQNKEYIGYSTFKRGVKEGPTVKYNSGKITDSMTFQNGIQLGNGYIFNDQGKIIYKSYIYHGRNVGEACEYDSLGKISHYYFYNFEGELIYQSKRVDSSIAEAGKMLNYSAHMRNIDDKNKLAVFLYLILNPFEKNYYELAILDSNKKILRSQRIPETTFFYENYLDTLQDDKSYAIIIRQFNPTKGREDLIISEIAK